MKKTRLRGMLVMLALLALGAAQGAGRQAASVQASSVQADAARMLIPGGHALGVALKTQGVLVISPGSAAKTPLRVGDVIVAVEDTPVSSAQELSARVSEAQTDSIALSVLRAGRQMRVETVAAVNSADGRRRLGVWVRDSTAGVGTLSYIDPRTHAYGALGHAIVDGDTGDMLSVKDGAILEADVVGVTKGENGRAGELRGSFLKAGRQIGTLESNCSYGIYGFMEAETANALYPQGLPAGSRRQAHEGEAQILSTVDGEGIAAYSVRILRCFDQNRPSQKGMVLKVTDERLLQKTGGIVQGMSGSPIIQDGRIIGAVTHVYLNDPTQGYGMYIEWMLDQSDALDTAAQAA